MPDDRPDAVELVEAVREFLLNEVAPQVHGQLSFHVRVAANALAIAAREWRDGPALRGAARERLARLLNQAGEYEALNRELCRRILAGQPPPDRAGLLAHMRQTAADKLRLANPRYARSDDD
ncbi:MAG: hypothetical protein FJX68_14690 [Alphaproteobacteria bacterium]|nr:hypothetical protein [Alphaproteobacteria bacterium]